MICARCKKQMLRGETQGTSSIYGSRHVLCEPCFFDEYVEIEEAGTNNLPQRLATYGVSNE